MLENKAQNYTLPNISNIAFHLLTFLVVRFGFSFISVLADICFRKLAETPNLSFRCSAPSEHITCKAGVTLCWLSPVHSKFGRLLTDFNNFLPTNIVFFSTWFVFPFFLVTALSLLQTWFVK